MTSAVATPTSDSARLHQAVPIIILGTDALLAALPATPVQLAHACLRAGFANAVPASWGDELIAAAVLRRLPQFEGGPAIQCSCPIVAHRLLSASGDLRPAMLGLVAPPVAIARYIRALSGATPVRLTYVGDCPGANDGAIDIRMRPDALLALLAERDISIADQPRVFESILPPDRRRFRSQPGGVPAVDAMASEGGTRTLVEMDTDDFVTELAQQLLTGKNVLIDAGPHLGCVCSGAAAGVAVKDARACVVALEPPRAMMPVIDESMPIALELEVPAAPRSPVDVSAIAAHASAARAATLATGAAGLGSPPSAAATSHPMPPLSGHRFSPVRPMAVIPEPRAASRTSGPASQRSVLGVAPVARDGEGKSLPRAYVARRRPSPRAVPVVQAAGVSPIETVAPIAELPGIATSAAPIAEMPRISTSAAPIGELPAMATSAPPTAPTVPALTPERSRYEPPIARRAVVPEPITFFDRAEQSRTSSIAPPRPTTPPSVPRTGDSAHLPRHEYASQAPSVPSQTPRPSSRPRPTIEVERTSGAPMSSRRLFFVALGVAIVLSVLVSIVSAVLVTRFVRTPETQTPAAHVVPPASRPD
jgi:hypothetical protein